MNIAAVLDLDPAVLTDLPRPQREEVLALLEEQQRRVTRNKILTYYPDAGPLRRGLYRSTWPSSPRAKSTASALKPN